MKKPHKFLAINKALVDEIYWRNMSLKSQKLFFMPLTQIFWGHRDWCNSWDKFIVEVSKEYIQDILNVRCDKKHINSNIKEWFGDMILEANGYYKEYKNTMTEKEKKELLIPFEIYKFTDKEVLIKITKPEYFVELVENSKKGFMKIPTDSIMQSKTKYMLPLYICFYYYGQRVPKAICCNEKYLQATTISLKYALGLDILDYCTMPKAFSAQDRYFLYWYTKLCTNRYYHNSEEKIAHEKRAWLKEECILPNSNLLAFETLEDAENYYLQLMKQVHFKRYEFEQKVLIPILEELNQSGVFDIHEQEVQVRSKKGERATIKKSLFKKNYPTKTIETAEEREKYPYGQYYDYGRVYNYEFRYKRLNLVCN